MVNYYPMTISNQITKDYYHTVVGMQNNGTTKLMVAKNFKSNGSYKYITYHLVSSR